MADRATAASGSSTMLDRNAISTSSMMTATPGTAIDTMVATNDARLARSRVSMKRCSAMFSNCARRARASPRRSPLNRATSSGGTGPDARRAKSTSEALTCQPRTVASIWRSRPRISSSRLCGSTVTVRS